MHYNLHIALYNLPFTQYTSHIALYTLHILLYPLYLKLKIRLHLNTQASEVITSLPELLVAAKKGVIGFSIMKTLTKHFSFS